MFGEDFLLNFLERVDETCDRIDNSLNELFHKLLNADFYYIPLIDLQERFLAQAFTETLFDHAVLLMAKNPSVERILTPILGEEIDTIRQNMEDGENVLRNADYYKTELIAPLKSSSPILYQECLEFQIVHHYIGEFVRMEGKASFRPWLRSITLTRISEYRKGLKGVPALLSDTSIDLIRQSFVMPPPLPGEEEEEESEKQIAFNQALELLKSSIEPQTWEAFYLTAVAQEDSFSVASFCKF